MSHGKLDRVYLSAFSQKVLELGVQNITPWSVFTELFPHLALKQNFMVGILNLNQIVKIGHLRASDQI